MTNVTTLYNKRSRAILGVHESVSDNKIETDVIGHIDGIVDPTYWIDENLTPQPSIAFGLVNKTVDVDTTVTITVPTDAWVLLNGILQQVTDGILTLNNTEVSQQVQIVGQYRSDPVVISFVDIDPIKASARTKVDTLAEAQRASLMTAGTGQMLTYIMKSAAAKAYLAGETLDAIQQSWIDAEAERTGLSMTEAAQSIVDAQNATEQSIMAIDKVRLDTKKAITDATTVEDVAPILANISWS